MLADSTGSTPSQLAIEKGHRLLGLHLAEYKYRQVSADRSRPCVPLTWMVAVEDASSCLAAARTQRACSVCSRGAHSAGRAAGCRTRLPRLCVRLLTAPPCLPPLLLPHLQDRKRAGSSGLWAVLDRLHLSPIIWIIIMVSE